MFRFSASWSVTTSLALLLVLGCDSETSGPGAGPETDLVLEFDENAGVSSLLAPSSITEASLEGDVLTMTLNFSGGCAEHDFEAIAQPTFLESFPVQFEVWIRHDDNGDACDGLLWEQKTLGLSEVRDLYVEAYGRTDPIRVRVFTAEGESVELLYEPR